MPESIVLLHGFSGTRRTWDGVAARLDRERYRPVPLDLPGHGEHAAAQGPITFEGCIEHVLARSPEQFMLCGYSLGGRVALQVALAAPQRVSALVLVSGSAGIEDPAERARRRAADASLADEFARAPIERFIALWGSLPLFADDPPEVQARAREDQRRNRPAALAAVLRGIGGGQMEPLWQRLGELTMPVTVIAGERDHRYRALGERIAREVGRGVLIVVPGGHRLALENPAGLVEAIQRSALAPARGAAAPRS